jgi:small-conductance mechanosensitive channel
LSGRWVAEWRALACAVLHQLGADHQPKETALNNLIYIVGLVVVVIAVLSFFGLR